MRIPARWVVLPLLAAPLGAGALELGEIDIRSALNQPFLARIGLQVEALDEREGLSVELASQETFERYGLDRPEFLSLLEFRVARTADGGDFVLVSSQDPIAEPFVTMLVEATWQRGRVLREYTVLLDPPLLLPEPVAAVPVEPAETQAPQANIPRSAPPPPTPEPPAPQDAPALEPSPQAPPTPEAPEPQDAPEPQNASELEPSPQAPPSPEVTPVLADGGSHGPVQRGETLWGIAESYRPEDITVYQMLVALYEANPEAFGANMNMLYAGAVLRIPERAELVSYTASASVAEFVRQTDEWQGRVQQQARLRLLPPDPDPGAAASAAEAGAASRDSDVGELREEVAALRSELDESQRLLEIRDQELRDLQAQVNAAGAAEPAADPESDPVFADESGSAPGDATAEDRPPEPVAAPSFVSRVWQFVTGPFVLIAIAAALVVFMAFLFQRRRQRSELPAFDLRMMTAGLRDADADRADPKGSRSEDKRTADAPPEDAPKADAPSEDAPTADEIGSKLDLARAYTDMGDAERARKALAEVLEDGDPDQRREAQTLLDALDE